MVAAWRRGATAVLAVRRSRPEGLATRAAAGFYYRTLRRLAFSQMPAGRIRLLPDRPPGDRLPGRGRRGPHVAAGAPPLGRVPDGARALRPRRARGGRVALDASPRSSSTSWTPSSRSRTRRCAGCPWPAPSSPCSPSPTPSSSSSYKLVHGQPIQGWTSLMVALAFFSGVQLALARRSSASTSGARSTRRGPGRASSCGTGPATPGAVGRGLAAPGSRRTASRHALDFRVGELREDRQREHFLRRALGVRESRPRGRRAPRSSPEGAAEPGRRPRSRRRARPAACFTPSRSATRTTYWW